MFREAFNKIQDTGLLKNWGVTEDSKLYFDLSLQGDKVSVPKTPNHSHLQIPTKTARHHELMPFL